MEKNSNSQNTAYDQIKKLIMTAELKPGMKLSKNELVKLLKIGDTPVREAILRLSKEGLLTIIPQSGTYVSKINMQEVYEALFVRENIETIVFCEASDKITPEEITSLDKKILIQQIYDDVDDPEMFFKLDEEFHAAFYQIANKQFVWRWMQLLNLQLNRYRFLRLEVTSLPRHSITDDHHRLLELVKKNDHQALKKAVSKHLHLIDQDVASVKAHFPTYFTEEGIE